MLNYARQAIKASPHYFWFRTGDDRSWWKWFIGWAKRRVAPKNIDELVVPIPTIVGVTPWSYDETTWHDFVADTNNWLVYAGHNWAYKSMSLKLGQTPARNVLDDSNYLLQFAPLPLPRVALTNPIRRRVVQRPHQRIAQIKNLAAY